MNMNKVSEDFYTSGQIGFSDLPKLAEQGIKSIICARPDDEEGNQPLFADIAEEARKFGIFAMHVPILPGQACKADVDKFAQGYFDMPKPMLGYCRSGARAHSLWELNQEATAMHVPMGE
ncbi:TIGR01244 family sulfur transferase [Maritalea sp.]|uniref:TIGR01244 family sulfur transferase n=1 Tax=Maritalea sp. TaxID=2003361 RepID=UPI003EF5A2D1